jgi:acyl carrier protein
LLVEELQKIAAHTLGIEHTQAIDPTLTWIALGLDSLMLIRLRNLLMEAVGQALPATLFFDYPTAETLAGYLLEEIATEKQPDASGVSDITILPSDWPPVVVEQSAVERTTVRNCEPSVTMQMYYEWYTAALVSGEGSYLHVPFPLRIGADVDTTALQQACQALVDRHQAFRSTFVQTDGALIHCVHPSRRVDFEVIAAQSWTDDKLQRQIEASVAQPFDFTQDSLVRFRLFTRNQDAILLITFHHIIMDGGSSPTFFRELEICYRAFAAGDSPSLPPVPLTLVDFNRWLQAVWASPVGGKLAAHWRQKIAGLQPLRSHIFDRQPQPTGPLSNAGKEHHFHFDPALYQAMVALAERNGLTINNICLAGFMLLLACYTEQDDVVVGSSSMNRSNPEFAHVIGCLANNPLIRVTIADDPTLETFVQRVRNAFFDTYTHQTYSWKFIKALLVEAGHEIQSVLFPFTYAFQHFESVNKLEAVNMADDRDVTDHADMGLSLEPYHGQGLALRPEAWSYLGIELSSTGESIGGFAHYYSDLFDEATVARLMAQYQELLARIVAEPAVRLSTVRSLNH